MCNDRSSTAGLLDQLASDRVLAQAFRWLCETRNHYHYNDDVWHVRHWWAREQPRLQAQLRAGTYRLSECRLVRGRERTSEIWCAMDTVVRDNVPPVLLSTPYCRCLDSSAIFR